MGAESFRVIVHDQGVSHVDTIEGEVENMYRVIVNQEDDESPLWVTCVMSLVTLW
jgi:hypothetical protein